MTKHTQSKNPAQHDFAGIINQAISPKKLRKICQRHEPVPRRRRKCTTEKIVRDLVYHQLLQRGTLAQHGAMLGEKTMTDSAYAQRRKRLPKQLFDEVLDAALKPLAEQRAHPDSFYKGWRLVGIDGTEMSVLNTPGNATLRKAKTRRGKAAFAKVRLVLAMELGVHNPLAAQSGPSKTYEVDLALELLPKVPPASLVIFDRLYGVAKHYRRLCEQLEARQSALLVRVRNNLKVRVLKRLDDASALVEVSQGGKKIVVREIRAKLKVPGKAKQSEVRLWTNLLDADRYPAGELMGLYGQRWEQELGNKELKLDMRNATVLDSHNEHTAWQEIAGRVLAMACVARMRVDAARSQDKPVLRMSFQKVLLCTLGLWEAFWHGGTSLGERQRKAMVEKYYGRLEREAVLPARRVRRCVRAVRQTVSAWPRLIKRTQSTTPVRVKITS